MNATGKFIFIAKDAQIKLFRLLFMGAIKRSSLHNSAHYKEKYDSADYKKCRW